MQTPSKAAKLVRREIKIDTMKSAYHFPPEAQESLSHLAALVRHSEHFDTGMLETVREHAAGKPLPLDSAIVVIAAITREAMSYVHATGDKAAKGALDDFIQTCVHTSPTVEIHGKSRARD